MPWAGTGRSCRLVLPRPSQPRPEKLWLHALLPRLSLHFPFGLLFHAALRQMHSPQIVLRASFSLEFLGPRTCETESCMPVACSVLFAQLQCLASLLAAQLLLLTVTLCASVCLPGYLFQA